GGKKPETAEKQHQAGLLAVVGDKVVVVDLGMVTGEALTPEMLRSLGPARVKSVALKGLKAGYSDSAAGTVLHIYGELDLTATFPASCGTDNPGKAALIAKAVMRG
ncbi:MAG: hypothetical protein NTW87_26900, partial [Planctomycetota bacterium]|nr:hypothetical protein [Planctomycetota bacterium]